MRWVLVTAALVASTLPARVFATPETEKALLEKARNHFEFRDFQKVIEVLNREVHPPTILDPARLAEAQELLGIAFHVTGKIDQAKLEFEQVLLHDPDRKLDPFTVPPPVIETFESLRTAMKERLDRIRAERGTVEPEPDLQLGAPLPHPVFAWAPFGLAHFFALDAPEWGSLWLALQVIGLGANIGAYFLASGLEDPNLCSPSQGCGLVPLADRAAYDRYQTIRIGGAVLFGASWIGSAIHGHLLLADQTEDRRLGVPAARAVGFSPTSPLRFSAGPNGASVTLRF